MSKHTRGMLRCGTPPDDIAMYIGDTYLGVVSTDWAPDAEQQLRDRDHLFACWNLIEELCDGEIEEARTLLMRSPSRE